MSTTSLRSLETASKSSMDVQNLNNLVSSFRIAVKKSKVDAIHKLTSSNKKLKNRRGSKEQIEANEKKSHRFLEEIAITKKLNLDKVVKFALGNTFTLDEVASTFKNDLEMKAMVRLSLQNPLQNRVNKWRTEHADWKDLSAFIAQHTGRRFRLKESHSKKDIETKPKFKHQQNQIKPKVSTDVAKDTPKSERNDDSSYHSDSSSAADQKMEIQESNLSRVINTVNSLTSCEVHKKPTPKTTDKVILNNKNIIEDDSIKIQDTAIVSSIKKDIKYRSDTLLDQSTGEQLNNVVQNIKKDSPQSTHSSNPEMVVAKFNLDDLSEDVHNEEIAFIFKGKNESSTSSDSQKQIKKKTTSSFFLTGDEETDSTTQDKNKFEITNDNEDLDEDRLFDAKRVLHESTFMGSLAGGAHKFKDYAGFRKDTRRQKKEQMGVKTYDGQSRKGFSNLSVKDKKSHTGLRNQSSSQKPEVKVEENLHPSWEASKKRKLQAVIPAFAGKKKTFDD